MNTHRSRGWRSVPHFSVTFSFCSSFPFSVCSRTLRRRRGASSCSRSARRGISMSLSAVSASFVSIALPRVSPPHLAFLATSLKSPLRRPRPRELLHGDPADTAYARRSRDTPNSERYRSSPRTPQARPPARDPSHRRPRTPRVLIIPTVVVPPPRSSAPPLRARLRSSLGVPRVSPLRLRDAPARAAPRAAFATFATLLTPRAPPGSRVRSTSPRRS